MLFRVWHHACQVAFISFLIIVAGMVNPSLRPLATIGHWIVLPIGIIGGLLAGLMVAVGIQSACPLCGAKSLWVSPIKNPLNVNCEKCGLVGTTLWSLRPKRLED